jgi:brefeldin A-inhibited guanine nucleotide-exchange protein
MPVDPAYTLAYLLIMLHTNLYNPQVKEKWKLGDFMKIGKGILVNNRPLTEAYLTGLYNKIVKKPLAEFKQHEMQAKILQDVVNSSIKKVKNTSSGFNIRRSGEYIVVQDKSHLPSMLSVVWVPLLALFVVILETSDDQSQYVKTVGDLATLIRLLGSNGLTSEKEACAQSLLKFAGNINDKTVLTEKNAYVIKAVIDLATRHGSIIRTSWGSILDLISRCDYLLLVASMPPEARSSRFSPATIANAVLIRSFLDEMVLEEVFMRSSSLDDDSLLEFMQALCAISQLELVANTPRMFSLSKIVFVADVNLSVRNALQWSRIWDEVKTHLSNVGCSSNHGVVEFVINSLKMLSTKFIEVPFFLFSNSRGIRNKAFFLSISKSKCCSPSRPFTTPGRPTTKPRSSCSTALSLL